MASSSSAAAAAIPDTEEMRKLIEDAQSRAAAAMGADALRKLKDASFIISGLSGLGVETGVLCLYSFYLSFSSFF